MATCWSGTLRQIHMAGMVAPTWQYMTISGFGNFGDVIAYDGDNIFCTITSLSRSTKYYHNPGTFRHQSHIICVFSSQDAVDFAEEWRARCYTYDDVHVHTAKEYHHDRMGRILDDILTTPHWSHIAEVWGESDSEDLTMIGHNLDDTNLS
ncbi:hypothetical protein EV424DRAFT_1556728 [Suillus variegatus]|nr:hypothetical protein EV424DRAFT_1556728 [Suillus variegatus]